MTPPDPIAEKLDRIMLALERIEEALQSVADDLELAQQRAHGAGDIPGQAADAAAKPPRWAYSWKNRR